MEYPYNPYEKYWKIKSKKSFQHTQTSLGFIKFKQNLQKHVVLTSFPLDFFFDELPEMPVVA